MTKHLRLLATDGEADDRSVRSQGADLDSPRVSAPTSLSKIGSWLVLCDALARIGYGLEVQQVIQLRDDLQTIFDELLKA